MSKKSKTYKSKFLISTANRKPNHSNLKKSLYMFKKVDQLNSSLNHQVSHRNNRNRLF